MASYFDEEDAEYNSDEVKSINSDDDKVFSKKIKKNLSTSLKSTNHRNDDDEVVVDDDVELDENADVDEDDDDDEEDDDEEDDDDEDNENLDEDQKKDNKKNTTSIPLFDYEHQVDDDMDETDDDDDDDEDEMYIKKFDRELNKQFLQETHPECIRQNYDEVDVLSKVITNKQGVIIDDLHKTNPYLTKYERTKILGIRAKQLNAGATPFVDIPEKVIDGYTIAELELKAKKIPFIIRRPLPCGASEYWHLNDLEDLSF